MREKLYTIFLISIHALREEGDLSKTILMLLLI